ncbi:hypothetical protein NBO_86g0003 [Nosema bombycis CQ1]|uniref:Uncharacterized protein n=1 Tax=Nosema bombycis (strain CQ1 / CVCC 102059) TaxID=578461 RepID=R0MKE1_NOSB1|nr:hypothetical protein NBO_86g0003 [Nosema bombycis CQ1]|eukprot:EOB13268.1 hypothetical protein NBO_86g0003 [Nosema bombycis CQ1]
MDEIRIQVLNEIKQIGNLDHLQDIRKHLSNLSLTNASISEISSLLLRNRIEDCIIKVIEGNNNEVEEFIKLCDINSLVDINSNLLLGLLEKIVLHPTELILKRDEIVKTILSDIEPNSLTDDELRSFSIILSQIKDSEIIENLENDNILFLCCYFIKQIPKILNKRGRK